MITFDTDPARYRHWRLTCGGPVATLTLDVAEDGGLDPGYRLKLNSYDLGVDIELADALNRIRFEHPTVRVVVLTSGKERVFSSGANIYMLGQASHAQKVDFCKFTNETRNGIEDSSANSGLKFLAAVNGACAGGGYELALACDEIIMVDDRSSTVSLPEVALLGVLPGTGGLTRLVDKRRVRRDLADVFCTTAEGVRADRALAWRLVDWTASPARFQQLVGERAAVLAASSDRPAAAAGMALPPLDRSSISERGWRYRRVAVEIARAERVATVTVTAPGDNEAPPGIDGILAAGAGWWPLAMARELDDALLLLRANEREIGTLVLKTRGDIGSVLACDAVVAAHRGHWFVRETIGLLRRTLQRLEVSSRSLFAVVDEGSCFAGSLFELALAADRSYMLADGPRIALGPLNRGGLEMANGRTRLAARFNDDKVELPDGVRDAATALAEGLVTFAPDELDWGDEIRLAIEERASLSPDALSGMEANLRFAGAETVASKIFARLSAWQNWVFSRPNATGEHGALKRYGSGAKPRFDRERV
ncbi:MAG: 2,3-epoxybenzoyl-CoA dihydrolase [Stellaceae bacterium]|jgi:benzoyl-CoA-dihydrodiol lyase